MEIPDVENQVINDGNLGKAIVNSAMNYFCDCHLCGVTLTLKAGFEVPISQRYKAGTYNPSKSEDAILGNNVFE